VGAVCVMHTNWGPMPKKRKPWDYDENDSELPGIILHKDCFKILLNSHPQLKSVSIGELFKKFKILIPKYRQCLKGVDYGNREKSRTRLCVSQR
jgi:hypothetical protein